MKTISITSILVALTILTSYTLKQTDMTLFDFSEKQDLNSWKIVNDGVMGGISSSSIEITAEGHGLFSGKVSTQNNGGFASVRCSLSAIEITDKTKVCLRIKGDGKNYQFRIKEDKNTYYSYITTFSTSGEWETISIDLNDFYPSFRGRKLSQSNFNHDIIKQVSFLIANKKNESFKLEIDKIELK